MTWWKTPWLALPVWSGAVIIGVAVAERHLRRSRQGGPPPICPLTFTSSGGVLGGVEYLETRSGDVDPETDLPLVVVLHGRDSHPTKIAEIAEGLPLPARIVAPFGFLPPDYEAPERRWLTSDVGDPDFPSDLAGTAAGLDEFLALISKCRPTVGRPVVAGYDQGATLAYSIGSELPELAGAVVGAAGMPLGSSVSLAVPMTVIHGRDDAEYGYPEVSHAATSMIAAGAPVALVPMAGVGHSFAGALQVEWLQRVSDALDEQRRRET